MQLNSADIAKIVSGHLIGPGDIIISNLITDSRKATLVAGDSLFVSLKGERSNGHRFIIPLYALGVRVFITEKGWVPENGMENYSDAAFICVDNCLLALQKLAAAKRDDFNGQVIAITGSNGKTIVKEWFSDILGSLYDVLRSPRSYNSQIGVPLSVWNLNNSYDYGVFEAGMSMPGEIERLETIIVPHTGVITNIGEAHQENFLDIESKVREKLKLFTNCKSIIYSSDQDMLADAVKALYSKTDKELISWSFKYPEADYFFTLSNTKKGALLILRTKNIEGAEFMLPFSDRASVQNAATVITMLLHLNLEKETIASQIAEIKAVEMRMEQKEGINGCTLIDDYYNSDPAALSIALDFLKQSKAEKKRVILSDFVQHRSGNIYNEVAELVSKAEISSLICIGEELRENRDSFPDLTVFFDTTEEFLNWFKPEFFRDETILLKGARKFAFERISSLLVKKAHITTLEVNLDMLLKNLNLFRAGIGVGTKVMAMVKAFAYGGGPGQISEWLIKNGVDFLAVAYVDEGVQLREYGINARIMVMNPDPRALSSMINYDLEPEIYSFGILEDFISELKASARIHYPVHIKLDTGMHRLGFMDYETEQLCSILAKTDNIRIASVFSHLAASEDKSMDQFTHLQAERYLRATQKIENTLSYTFIKHLVNSAGAIRFPEYHFDMLRLGIGLFGAGINNPDGASPVISFYSSVSQVKRIEAGEGVGYGLSDKDHKKRDIAIVPVGYADGLNRKLGNGKGKAFINNSRVPFVGKICMDMAMLDVSGLDVKRGDRVEIFGVNISVAEVAAQCETIPYEIISGISPRVKRVYLYD